MSDLYALIMAGGRGTRFWPTSRREHPKQVIPITGKVSLLRQTVDRLLPLVPAERILVITGPDMLDAVRSEVRDLPENNLLVEPSTRNTAPCIGWGAVEVGRRGGGDAVMAVLPADHDVQRPDELRAVLWSAAESARHTNALITLGITPTRPETGFGYLEIGHEVGTWGSHRFLSVERFTEKPDSTVAREYVTGGRHLWNAGMFVFTVDSIRDAFRRHLPRSAEALEEIQGDRSRVPKLWQRLDATSVDYGIMERSRHILTVPCDIGWSDVGSWTAVADLMPSHDGVRGVAKAVVSVDAQGCVVHAPDKLVALLGVHNIVVVDSGDALLVMERDRAQDVRQVLDRLENDDLRRFT